MPFRSVRSIALPRPYDIPYVLLASAELRGWCAEKSVMPTGQFVTGFWAGTSMELNGSLIWDLDVQGAYLDIPIPDDY